MAQQIKSMKLYSALERIHNDIAALGYGRSEPLDARKISAVDQLHYHGTAAVDAAAKALGIGTDAQVLDIGSGFGGPARWLAETTGARIDAVELQPDMHESAKDLTRRCGLAERVRHRCGDILAIDLPRGGYDAAVSWLALYHIPNRAPLFPRLWEAMRPGGGLFVEDLYQRGEFTVAEQVLLDGMLAAGTMTSRADYVAELKSAGFEDIDFADMTQDWAAFTAGRLAAFRESRDAYVARQSKETFRELETFYSIIADLLAGGRLGGVRLTARKPG